MIEPAEDDTDCSPKERTTDFPPTRFYPGYLSASREQPIAVYIVHADIIKAGNAMLGFDYRVLTELGQSLILPDSCVWNEISAERVRMTASGEDGEEIEQCHEATECVCEADEPGCECPPCIWYAEGTTPYRTPTETDGTGAGIVGLREGRYTVKVEASGEEVSKRTFSISPGEMVIMRTWPNVPTSGSPR